MEEDSIVDAAAAAPLPLPYELTTPEVEAADDVDVVWSPFDTGSLALAGAILEAVRRKDYCVVQTIFSEELRAASLEEGEQMPTYKDDFNEETVADYMGLDNCTKAAYLPGAAAALDGDGSAPPALTLLDALTADLAASLAPQAYPAFGFSLPTRSEAMVRVPFADRADLIDARPLPLDTGDIKAGKVEEFLTFVRRRKLCMLLVLECESGEIELLPRDVTADDISLPAKSNRLLIFRHDRMGYRYRPEGPSVALQAWLLAEEIIYDPDEVEIPGTMREVHRLLDVTGTLPREGSQSYVMSACVRLPGRVDNPLSYWNLFSKACDCGTKVPLSRFDVDIYFEEDPDISRAINATYTRHGGWLEEGQMFSFDYDYFGFTHKEASVMAPGQWLFLEEGYHAAYKARYRRVLSEEQRELGLYLGDVGADWHTLTLGWNDRVDPTHSDPHAGLEGVNSLVTVARLSMFLGTMGPMLSCSTACSSSLVAMAHAHHDMVDSHRPYIVGGINTMLAPINFIMFCASMMLSTKGRCFTYNDSADGFMRGEGIGCTLLEWQGESKLWDDRWAGLAGTFCNQDGRSASLTAPHGPSQLALIKSSLRMSQLDRNDVHVAECHGTGTALGDPIEVGALQGALCPRKKPCYFTSAKSVHGHLESGAGIAGFTKCLLILSCSTTAANVHFRAINPNLLFDGYPCMISSELADAGVSSTCAGVSSFGATGTNGRADVISIATRGPRNVAEAGVRKLAFVTRPCPKCFGQMHWLCGTAITKEHGVGTFRCSTVRDDDEDYEFCSNCYQGGYRVSSVTRVPESILPPAPPAGLFISGTWNAWSELEPMEQEQEGIFTYDLVVTETGCERFRIYAGASWKKPLYPIRDRAERCDLAVIGPPGDDATADADAPKCWLIDARKRRGRTDRVEGAVYRITFTWQAGHKTSMDWQPAGYSDRGVAYPHSYHLVGSFANWECKEMACLEDGSFQGCFQIGLFGQESFQIVRDKDRGQTIYPVTCDSSDEEVVAGPDDGWEGRHFTAAGRHKEVIQVLLRVADGHIEVTTFAAKRRVEWRSVGAGGGPRRR